MNKNKIKNIYKKVHQTWKVSGYGLFSIVIFRFGNFIYNKVKIPIIYSLLLLLYKCLDLIIVQGLNNSEIHYPTKIGHTLSLPHGGKGVIISSKSKIGNNVTIYHQVTIGTIEKNGEAPTIGNNVLIGAGAKILGPITIGDGVNIGANAVVIKSVPPNKTAVGVPAEVK